MSVTLKTVREVKWGKPKPNGSAEFLPGSFGPFNCGHCEYFSDRGCRRPETVREFKLKRIILGTAKFAPVDDDDCCRYFWPKGR